MRFTPHDPTWIVELARKQRPDLPWLAEALARCTAWHKRMKGRKKKCIYAHFVTPDRANQIGAEWQYRETVSLDHPEFGHIKLDVLKDGRVGGIEFYDRLFSSGKPKPPTALDSPSD